MSARRKVFRPIVSELLESRTVPSAATPTVEVASLHTIGGVARGRLAAHDLLQRFSGGATLTLSDALADVPAQFRIDGVTAGGATLSGALSLGGFLPQGSPQTSGTLNLSNARGSVTLAVQGVSNILATDLPPTLFYRIVGGTGVYHGASGTGQATITASLTGPFVSSSDPSIPTRLYVPSSRTATASFSLSFQPDHIPARTPTTIPLALAGQYAGASQSTHSTISGLGGPATIVTLNGGLVRPHPGFASLSGSIEVPDHPTAGGPSVRGSLVLSNNTDALTLSLERIDVHGAATSGASGLYRVSILAGSGRYAEATGTGLARLAVAPDGSFLMSLRGTFGRQ